MKNYPNLGLQFIDSHMEYPEAVNYLNSRHPEQMIPARLQEGELFGFSSYMSPFDISERVHECIYCGKVFKPERSTAKYCYLSHRVLEFRRRRKAQLAEPNTTSVTRDPLDDRQ
jgi:hypothetical protein